jgi:hypothetical protein
MKKTLLFAALAFAAVACNEEVAQEETSTSTEVVVPASTEDEIPGPGHVEEEEGGMVEGPGSSATQK